MVFINENECDDLLRDNVEDDPSLRNKVEVFKDRTHAGELLADKLLRYGDIYRRLTIVVIPSGGLPIGYAVAKRLHAALDLMLVRKIPIPWNPEAGFGSVTLDGSVYLNLPLVRSLELSEREIRECVKRAKDGLSERAKRLLNQTGGKMRQNLEKRSAVLVDDGLASGYTMLASVASVKKRKPSRVIVAVPTGSAAAIELVSPSVERLICLNIRSGFSFAVADAYKEWHDISEEESVGLLMKFKTEGFLKFK